MKQNVFIKYILRTPIRSILLAVLIGASSFMLISQVVEYAVVSNDVDRIEGFYRSIGYLDVVGEPNVFIANVTSGTELISESQYIDFEDRQTYYFASLRDFQNTETYGWPAREEEYTYREPQVADVFFYGVLLNKSFSVNNDEFGVGLTFIVDYKVTGYPEHVTVGEEVILYAILPMEMESAFDNMVIGQRYFMKGTYYSFFSPVGLVPTGILVLPTEPNLRIKPFGTEELWYVPAPLGVEVDYDLIGVSTEIGIVRENQRGMIIRTTADMTAMPWVLYDLFSVVEGRMLDRDDYYNENHVAVVDFLFAKERDLSVGDTLHVTLRDLPFIDLAGIPRCLYDWETYSSYEFELEIVGFHMYALGGFSNRYIYLPESIIPYEFFREDESTLAYKYSFVLNSTRYQQAFLDEYEDILLDLGIEIKFLEHNAELMWDIVNPILQSARNNVVIFGGIFLLILGLISTLTLFIWKRYFAILRALGRPARVGFCHMLFAITLIFLIPMLMGAVLARQVAMANAYESMEAILEVAPDAQLATYFPVAYAVGLWILLVIISLIIFSIGVLTIVNQPVLVLLQGGRGRKGKVENKKEKLMPRDSIDSVNSIDSVAMLANDNDNIRIRSYGAEVGSFKTNYKYAKSAARKNVFRLIFRQRLKSILAVVLALSFVVVIGYLGEAIRHREAEIDYFYDNIIVSAHIRETAEIVRTEPFDIVNAQLVNRVLDTGFVRKAYLEAGKIRTYLLSQQCYENMLGGNGRDELGHFDILFSFNDFGVFLHEYREWVLELPITITFIDDYFHGELNEDTLVQFEFGPDFGEEDFHFDVDGDKGAVIPILVGQQVMEERGLTMGDVAYVLNALTGEAYEARIIGIARGVMHGDIVQNAETVVFLPLPALEMIRGSRISHYVKAIFELDPLKNRDISYFRDEFQGIERDASLLNFELDDDELRMVVEPLEQTLLLLRILYPIIVVVSLLIGLGFAVLLSLQNAKEAAIMIVLGTQKRKAQRMLIFTQIIVCIVGLIVGQVIFLLLVEISGAYMASLIFTGCYFMAVLLGSIIGAIIVTKQSPLELLQVRE